MSIDSLGVVTLSVLSQLLETFCGVMSTMFLSKIGWTLCKGNGLQQSVFFFGLSEELRLGLDVC